MDANDFPRLFYTSMPSSSTSTQRIDRLSSSSSSTFRRDDFRRHSTTTSSAKFSTISIGESVKLEEENGEIPEKLVPEKDTVVKTEETRVSDCDFSLTFYTAHVTSSSMLSRGDSSSINNKTFTPDDHYSNPSDKRQQEDPSIHSTSSNSSSFGGHVAFVDEPTEEYQRIQPQQYQQHQFQLPTLLVTSTPSTVFDQNDDDVFTSPYHPPNRQYSSSSEMSGLSFQLQSGIHKKSIAVEGNEIALRDLRNEAFQFVKEIYPEKKCGSLEDYILLYKHDLRSINILQLITTSSDVTDGTLVEIVIGCESLIFFFIRKIKAKDSRCQISDIQRTIFFLFVHKN